MTTVTLFGAILGSGFFILYGRGPAQKLIEAARSNWSRRQR